MDAFDKFEAHLAKLKAEKVSQEQFGKQLGISQAAISKLKLRLQRPTLKFIDKLNAIIGTTNQDWRDVETIPERARRLAKGRRRVA